MDKEIKREIESIKAEINNLQAIIKMVNPEYISFNVKLEGKIEQLLVRIGRIEKKLWWIQGLLGSAGIAIIMFCVRLFYIFRTY